jgi:glutathione S-transferase
MLTLHHHPGNASLAPHIVLEELGAPYALQLVDRNRNAHKSPEYLRLNPNGLIPVLVDDDLVLYECAAITLHLVDTHPAAGLAPAFGTPERAHFYKWLVWMTNTLQAMLMQYFYPERMVDDRNADGAAQVKAHATQKVNAMLHQLDAQLATHGGDWLLASGYSGADAHALMLCRWTRGFARPARALPRLGPYLQRMLQRDAVRRAFEQEGIGEPLV